MARVASESIEDHGTKAHAEDWTDRSKHKVHFVGVRLVYVHHLDEVVSDPELEARHNDESTGHYKHVDDVVPSGQNVPYTLLKVHVSCLFPFKFHQSLEQELIVSRSSADA